MSSLHDDQTTRRLWWARLAVLVLVLGTAIAVAVLVGLPDMAALRADIAAVGPAAPGLFVLLYAVATLAPVPKNVFAAAAGVLFGLVTGVLVVLLAAMLGALGAFGLSRALGRDAVERLTVPAWPASTRCCVAAECWLPSGCGWCRWCP